MLTFRYWLFSKNLLPLEGLIMTFGRMCNYLILFIYVISMEAFAMNSNTTPTMGNTYPTRESLAEFYSASPVSFSQLAQGVPEDIDVLVWASHSTQLPEEAKDPKVVANLRRFVESGGGLFLVSFAQRYVVDLKLETVEPDRLDFFRYGYNDGSRYGGYFTVGFKGDGSHPLFAGMSASEKNKDAFYVSGSTHINLENCFWSKDQIKNGQSLGNYFRKNEKNEILDEKNTQLLNLWTLGKGKTLGYGANLLLEEYWFSHDTENLHKFLRNVATFLSGKKNPRIGALPETPSRLHADTYMSPPAFPQVQPHSLNRQLPGLPYIAHWGWHAQLNYQRANRKCIDVKYYKEKMIDEPFRWGANLLEFYPPGMERNEGYPFVWEDDDPMTPPKGDITYWGGNWADGWTKDKAREVFKLAHERDMLVQIFYHPNPLRVKRGTGSEEVVAQYQRYCDFQSREFQNPLLYGWRGAHDGLGSEWWCNGQNGEYISQIWKYNPGSYRYSTALLPKTGPYFHGSWMCAFARTGGINACGYGDRWRYVYHPPLYLSYQADSRSMKPSTREWGGWANYGGGSTPDWLVRQMHDFARDRLYLDSGIWWLGQPDATMREEERQFVYGSSTDPLRCAVTTSMRAVGNDGYRAKAYDTVKNLPRQYVCDEPYPQDTAFIQNNYFRLLRMGGEDRGILQYDPTRLADFHKKERPQPAQVVSPNFITSHPLGIETTDDISGKVVVAIGEVDGASTGFREAGGYEKRYTCKPLASEFPSEIRYERWPEWPHEIEVNFTADAGRYDVEIYTLPNAYVSTMEVVMDGRPAGVYFPQANKKGKFVLPVSLDESKQHKLLLRAQKAVTSSRRKDGQPGLAHGFDAVLIRRTGNESLVHSSKIPIGHQAVLQEVAFKDSSGAHRQKRTYTVVSDYPLIKVEMTNESPKLTTWETRIALPGYGDMKPLQSMKNTSRLGPVWRMKSSDDKLPPLVIFDYSEQPPDWIGKNGDDVVIHAMSGRESSVNIAVLIDDGLYGKADYARIHQMLLEKQTMLAIGDKPVTHKNRQAIPRVEVVSIKNPHGGPYMVAEANTEGETFWLMRGAQPAGKNDLLKLYMQPSGKARIQHYGYIEGIVKPGYGCQYSLAIKDNIKPGRCEVDVVKTGPFMFAPRIDWKEPFDSVKVNGKEWRYFDDNLVFLPNKPGRYIVEVAEKGAPAPSLGRTFLSVDSSTWNEASKVLELETSHPHWWQGPLPGNISYTALLLSKEYTPVSVEGGGSLIDWSEYQAREKDMKTMKANGAALRLMPGKTRIHFEKR
jgi:Domain of unknown function (DUF4960)